MIRQDEPIPVRVLKEIVAIRLFARASQDRTAAEDARIDVFTGKERRTKWIPTPSSTTRAATAPPPESARC